MKNNQLLIFALLGIGGYFAYNQYKKSQEGSFPDYIPTPSGGGSEEKKKLSFDDIMKLLNATLDKFNEIKLTYNQKITAVKEIDAMIKAGKSQQEIEIAMGNKYKLTPTQVASIVNKIYS